MLPTSDLPQHLYFFKEYQRIVFDPRGNRVERLDSGWWDDPAIAKSLLNDEYPDPTPTGYVFRLQERWVSEHMTVETERR